MKRIAVLLWLVLAGVVAAQQAPDDSRFTGKTVVMEGKDLSAARRRFEPGARTAWHSHDKGQLLLVEEGRMRTQKKGTKALRKYPARLLSAAPVSVAVDSCEIIKRTK